MRGSRRDGFVFVDAENRASVPFHRRERGGKRQTHAAIVGNGTIRTVIEIYWPPSSCSTNTYTMPSASMWNILLIVFFLVVDGHGVRPRVAHRLGAPTIVVVKTQYGVVVLIFVAGEG